MKPKKARRSVIMLLDQTFGELRLTGEKGPQGLAGIDLAAGTGEALGQLKAKGTRAIVVAPDTVQREALPVLKQFLPAVDDVVVYKQRLSRTLETCAKQFSIDLEQAIFVAADRMARSTAAKQGSLAVPHPAIAALMVSGRSLRFVRASGDREQLERLRELVPYFLEYKTSGSCTLLGVMSNQAVAEAIRRRVHIETLPLDISIEDPLFIRLDEIDARAATELSKRKILFTDGERALVAVGPADYNDSIPVHGAHGHFQLLSPNPELLRAAPAPGSASRTALHAFERWPAKKIAVAKLRVDLEDLGVLLLRCPSTAASVQADVNRYSGVANLDSSGQIVSRHIQHPDNARVVQALLNELRAIGYCAYTHSFSHAGLTLHNVIADLPGQGFFRIDPNILEVVRERLLLNPFPDPPDPWIDSLKQVVGEPWFKEQRFNRSPASSLRTTIEKLFLLHPWYPWWLKRCALPGPGAEIVIVGCHLDSTAGRTPGYNPATDSAPGADDDATGIANTLALARYLWSFRGKLTHTVRFCFFNAEEQGLVGSQAYAAMLKMAGAPIKAVVCADMIGFNSDAQRIFEVHAGFTDPAVRDLSVPIADRIASWAASLGDLAAAQIYKGTSSSGGTDRNLYDGAINRSDHGSFHQQGYPAVVVSEDFFVNLPTEPTADSNPNYHAQNDTTIDSGYTSDIVCAIAMAVKELAAG